MKKLFVFFVLSAVVLLFICGVFANNDYEFTNEAIAFAGYCYYIENGDIYRAPMTVLTGDTELFRKSNSIAIAISGNHLLSKDKEGDITYYSLISENDAPIAGLYSLTSEYEETALLGTLSAKYESNGNPAAISSGNDAGGVSFGAYQFASKADVPKAFSNWCISTENSVETGQRLLDAYALDGDMYGENFKTEWRAIASENPDAFLALQHGYVKSQYYDAIVKRIEANVENFDIDMYGIALKNVFWSRSVQHGVGGSYNVITRAFEALGGFDMQSEEILIRAIYAESGAVVDTGTYPMTGSTAESYGIAGKYMKYYSKNSSAVQLSVYTRLNYRELSDALNMLEEYGGYIHSDDTPYELGDIRASNITDSSADLFGTIYNYRLASVTEYGFFFGKTMNSLVDIVVSYDTLTKPVINFSASTLALIPELDPMTTYYFGIYAFIGGEYITSETTSFITGFAPVYTASFQNFDGTKLYSVTLREGRTPAYHGSVPTRPADAKYTYTFVGWDKEPAPLYADETYTALYDAALNSYTVRYFNGDGTVLLEEEIFYGEHSIYTGETPSKTSNRQFSFVFKGWSDSGENITEDRDIYPRFRKQDFLWDSKISSGFAGGDGTSDSPYLISCGGELAYLSEYVAFGGDTDGKYYRLTENIQMSTDKIIQYFTPIGSSDNPFSGNFDGGGHMICGLRIENDGYAGLFGVAVNAAIENLIIKDAVIKGDQAGMLSGMLQSNDSGYTFVRNCSVSGTVTGKSYVGGITGCCSGSSLLITNTKASGEITGNICGGICGYFNRLSLKYAFTDAIVKGSKADPLCGEVKNAAKITDCFYFSENAGSCGKMISENMLAFSSSYQNFDFQSYWTIEEGRAELIITAENDFEYYVYGDIDGNDRVDIRDAVMLAQYLAGWKIIPATDINTTADFNKDGKVNTVDAVILAQHLAGWSVELS